MDEVDFFGGINLGMERVKLEQLLHALESIIKAAGWQKPHSDLVSVISHAALRLHQAS